MTATNELRMPRSYVPMTCDEMEYVDGGGTYTWLVGSISSATCRYVYVGTLTIAAVEKRFCSTYGLETYAAILSTLVNIAMNKWNNAANGNGLNVYGMCNTANWAFMGYYTELR